MDNKFILKNSNGRITEIIHFNSVGDLNKKFCAEHISLGEITELDCSIGQVLEDGVFVDYVRPAVEVEAEQKFLARIRIERLQNRSLKLILAYVNSQADCPQDIKDLIALIKIEKDRL